MEDEVEDKKKKKADGTVEVVEAPSEDKSVKTMGTAANQGATKSYYGKGGKFIPGAKAAPVVAPEQPGLGAVAAAAAKKRADQAEALAREKK